MIDNLQQKYFSNSCNKILPIVFKATNKQFNLSLNMT